MALQANTFRAVIDLRQTIRWLALVAIVSLPWITPGRVLAEESKYSSDELANWYGTDGMIHSGKRSNSIRRTVPRVQRPQTRAKRAIDGWLSKESPQHSQLKSTGALNESTDTEQLKAARGNLAQRIGSSVSLRRNAIHSALEETVLEPEADSEELVLITPEKLDDAGLACDGCDLDGAGCCDGCDTTCQGCVMGLEVRVEGLLWWTDGFDSPPLVTTSPSNTPDPSTAGVLGQTGTSILFGGDDMTGGIRAGGRYSVTKWLSPCSAIDASYLHLGRKREDFSVGGSDDPIVARPFFNVELGAEGSGITAFPGVSSGTLDVVATSEFDLFDVNFRRSMCQGCGFRVDLLAGYRYSRLNEDLNIHDVNEAISGLAAGTIFDIRDSFDTESQFHGGQLGLLAEIQQNCWTFELLMKVALGNTQSTVDIDGSTITTPDVGDAVNLDGGFLALQSNMGEVTDNDIAVLPEFGVTISRPFGCWQISAGYSFLYWSRVVRPGDQIDRNLDPRQFPPSDGGNLPQPEPRFEYTDFWAQGIRLGLERAW